MRSYGVVIVFWKKNNHVEMKLDCIKWYAADIFYIEMESMALEAEITKMPRRLVEVIFHA